MDLLRQLRCVEAIPHVRAIVVNSTADSVEFNNGTCIEIHTCSFKSTRGYTLIGAACDEIAYWNTEDGILTGRFFPRFGRA